MNESIEYLETDGLGGYASGTSDQLRTRRYHGLLVTAKKPPTDRFLLVAGLEVTLRQGDQEIALSTHAYEPDVQHPDGLTRLASFTLDPWPTWTWHLPDGGTVTQELLMQRGHPATWVRFRGSGAGKLIVRPLFAGRDIHALHHENDAIGWTPTTTATGLRFQLYDNVPALRIVTNGRTDIAPCWYRDFHLSEEAARGFDATEDLASFGKLTFDLGSADAILIFAAELPGFSLPDVEDPQAAFEAAVVSESDRRKQKSDPLALAAEAYLVRRGNGMTVVAGYPWFTDWGRDTFIAMRGLCLSTGLVEAAKKILLGWADAVADGLLPNRYPDHGERPDDNAVDASLWYVIAVHDLLAATQVTAGERKVLTEAVHAILRGYTKGTRHGIAMDPFDGLLRAGVPGVQLTWMDAKIGDFVVTPRIGKPVEIQALWINALKIGAALGERPATFAAAAERAHASFLRRFLPLDTGALPDVVDDGHVAGAVDHSLRPNQILTVGGLPFALLQGKAARGVVDVVEQRLWTPLGMRSLDPADPRYVGRYVGDPGTRDRGYHQGTAWGWMLGPFVDAWLKVRIAPRERDNARVRGEAGERFLAPLLAHANRHGGHLPEIADGDLPQQPRGCPFQAWSVGEALRIQAWVQK